MASTQISEAYEGENTKHGAVGHLSADEELQQAVCEALIADAELDSTGIGVRVAGDTVVLEGSVKSKQARERALSIARSQRGVGSVQTDELCISSKA
jgi:osmotically-inducible protein OsmY